MSRPVQIVGIGMITPLGLDAEQTAASVGAGLSAFEESAIMDQTFNPFIMGLLPEDVLEPVNEKILEDSNPTHRETRLLRLSHPALQQALSLLPADAAAPSLFVGVPESQTTLRMDPEQLLSRLHVQCEEKFNRQTSQAVVAGRASGLKAVHLACQCISNGSEKIILAGGVDTFKDLYILATLDAEKRINSAVCMDGFIPGEGAAFLLLADPDYAAAQNLEVIATINGSSEGGESGHMYSDEPYKGEGLAGAVQTLLNNSNIGSPIGTVYSSMNGENHFAKEWGVTFIRNSAKIQEDYNIIHPADCYGDTGAASGPLMLGLAALGLRDGEIAGPALVYASSDTSLRAACLISAANGQRES